jgi:thiol-disulfide isomerase/thioredoxin
LTEQQKTKNMKRIIILATAIAVISTACTQRNTVTGHIEGLTDGTIFVYAISLERFEDGHVEDSVFAKDGKFEYTFPNNGAYILYFGFPQFYVQDRPTGGIYTPENSHLLVFAERGNKIRIKSEINSAGLSKVVVSGSKLNQDFSPIQSQKFEIHINDVEEEMALEQAMIDRNKEAEDIGWENRHKRLNARRELYSNFIKANLDNPLSAFLLSSQPLDSVGVYYDQLGENARNSIFRNMLDSEMERYKGYMKALKAQEEIVVGNKVPDFTLTDIDGKSFTLSSLRGKYVIIDFWGSWCAPCIAGMPKMKSIYEKYKAKLEIVGIACNEQSIDTWRNAVKQHELPWINVINDKSSAVDVMYGIMAYPTKIVINHEGIVLIHEQGEGDDFYTKLANIINRN